MQVEPHQPRTIKVSVYIASSLDGFIAREDGDVAWLHELEPIEGEDYGYRAFMDSVDMLVMGRKTFEQVLSFSHWPYDKPVMVLSSRKLDIPAELHDQVEVCSAAPQALLEQLVERGIAHIYIDGGKTIQSFLREGLVDELIISRIPRLLGRGIPLFADLENDIMLDHLDTRSFANGLVQSYYRLRPSS